MQRRRHRHLQRTLGNLQAQLEEEVVLNKLPLKFAEKKVYTLLYKMAEKKYVAVIYTLVARLREAEVKAMGNTVTTRSWLLCCPLP